MKHSSKIISLVVIAMTDFGAFCFILGLASVAFGQTVPVNVQKSPTTGEITGNLTIPTGKTLTINSAVTFGDGVTQTFNPNSTNAGLNVGSVAGSVSVSNNGDVWYNSSTSAFNFRIAGADVALTATPGPADATYITQTASSGLSAEQALSSLATGLVQVTTTTGVLSSVTTSAGVSGLISDESGSGALVFGTSPTIATPTISGAITFPDGVRQTFNPNAITPGLNVGAHTADPSTPSNGDVWYDSTGNLLRARINGATVSLGAGGGIATDSIWTAKGQLAAATGSAAAVALTVGTDGQVLVADSAQSAGIKWATVSGTGDVVGPASATDNALARFDTTTGKLIQNSNVTLADSGTALVFSAGAGLTAGVTNNDVTLTPAGTGTNVLNSGWRVGTASSTAATGNTLIYGTDSATATMTIRRADASTGGAQFFGSKARGTMASPTAPTSADRLAAIAAGGYNGVSWSDTQALFGFSASENWNSTAMGTSFSIGLTPNTTTTRADVFTIQGTGLTQIGAGSPAAGFLDSTQRVILPRESASNSLAFIAASATSTDRPILQALRSKGTLASPTTTASGDYIWSFRGGAHDGTNVVQGAEIAVIVDGSVSTGVVPVRMEFQTTATDSASRASRLTLKNTGAVLMPAGIASTSTTTGTAVVTGGLGVSGAAYIGGILNIATSTPASAGATGVAGTIAWDSSYIYICTATNTWKRVAIATW